MSAGGIFDEPVLVVSEGFNWLARRIVRQKDDEQRFEVWDPHQRVLAHVEPADRDSALGKAFRLALSLVFLGSTRRNVRKFRVVDPYGGTLLQLDLRGETLIVRGTGGDFVGEVRNTSPAGALEAKLFLEQVPRGLFAKWPEPAAVLRHKMDQPPFEYELETPGGSVVARVSNSGNRRNVLEVLDRSDPRLAALAVGFVCAMVDRFWLRARAVPTGGG